MVIPPVRVLEFLNSFGRDRSHHLSKVLGGEMLTAVCAYIEEHKFGSYEDIGKMFCELGYELIADGYQQHLIEFATEEISYADRKRDAALGRDQARGENRWRYMPSWVWEFYVPPSAGRGEYRPIYKTEHRADGLIKEIVSYYRGFTFYPVNMALLWRPENARAITPSDREAWKTFRHALTDLGVAVSGGRLGWLRVDPETGEPTDAWRILTSLFPNVVDFVAYNHGLGAPLVHEGYIPDVPVTFKVLRSRDGVDLATDGSGIYHPQAPQMQAFIAKHGLCAVQVRGVHAEWNDETSQVESNGMFFKGALFPSEDAVDEHGNPTICVDWLQVKGRFKQTAKKKLRPADATRTREHFHLGLLQAWNRRGKISSCFELGENIETDKHSIYYLGKHVTQAMNMLVEPGIDGLVAQIASEDPTIDLMVKLVEIGHQHGLTDVHSWQIPRVAAAVADKVGRRLYKIGEGSGLRMWSYVCRLGADIEPGTCVVAGMEPGKEVVGFRFPLILPQGLVKLRTVAPRPHHLVNGQEVPYTVIMNPADLTVCMQGDDDGDICGLSDDPTLVKMFDKRLDEKQFLIEPEGRALNIPTDSPKGLEFMQEDKRGAVGLATVIRAQLLAVGDRDGARAVSLLIQEFVDSAKRDVEYSDWREAVHLHKWRLDEHGRYHFEHKLPRSFYSKGFPIQKLRKWADGRLIAAGCYDIVTTEENGRRKQVRKARNPLWYRYPGKKVDIHNWVVPEETRFENLVHKCVRRAHREWHDFAKAEFNITLENSVEMRDLLPMVLEARGIPTEVTELTLDELNGLRTRLDIRRYNTRVREIRKKPATTEEAYHRRVADLRSAQLELEEFLISGMHSGEITFDDVATLWWNEWHHWNPAIRGSGDEQEANGNPNNAFRAICFPGSLVMERLGLATESGCPFLYKIIDGDDTTRLQWITQRCAGDALDPNPDPFGTLRSFVERDRKHAQEIEGPDGNPVPMHECQYCTQATQTDLVKLLRTRRGGTEAEYCRQLHASLKEALNHTQAPVDEDYVEMDLADFEFA